MAKKVGEKLQRANQIQVWGTEETNQAKNGVEKETTLEMMMESRYVKAAVQEYKTQHPPQPKFQHYTQVGDL
jgi:hypothetical protein